MSRTGDSSSFLSHESVREMEANSSSDEESQDFSSETLGKVHKKIENEKERRMNIDIETMTKYKKRVISYLAKLASMVQLRSSCDAS